MGQRNKLIFLGIFGGVIILVGFILLISQSSPIQAIIKEINNATTSENVMSIYLANGSFHSQERFDKAVREKLMSFRPSKEQMEAWAAKMPARPVYVNFIVVPDLSRRILEPNRMTQDTVLLHQAWEVFKAKVSKSKPLSGQRAVGDRFVVEISDPNAIKGFSSYADSLIVDHAKNEKIKPVIYNIQRENIVKNFGRLYEDASKSPKGADYVYYIDQVMPNRIIESDLFRQYRNCFLFITDGYLATQISSNSTEWKDFTPTNILEKNCKSKDFLAGLYLPEIKDKDYSNVEILVLGVTEYGNGQNCHFNVLQCFWRTWFAKLNIKNKESENFFLQNSAEQDNKLRIEQFLETKGSLPKRKEICGSQTGAVVNEDTKLKIERLETNPLKPVHLFDAHESRMRECNQLYSEIMKNLESNSYSKNVTLLGKRVSKLKELMILTKELSEHNYCKRNNLSQQFLRDYDKIRKSLEEDEKTLKELTFYN